MGKTVSVDFTGVETGGGKPRIPEGDYGLKITKVDLKKGKESGEPYLAIGLQPIKGNPKGVKKVSIPHTCSLQKTSLWNLRNLMEACGKTVPSKAVKIDIDKMIGWQCAGTVIDDEYDDRKYSIISAFFPMDDLVDYQEGDEEESPKKKKNGDDEEEEPEEEGEEIFG